MKKFLISFMLILVAVFSLIFTKTNLTVEIFAQDDRYAKLKEQVKSLSTNSGALIILPGGEIISKNPGQQFPSYSVIKLWIAASIFADAKAQGNQVDDSNLLLIQRMLQNSDNEATNELLAQLGNCENGRCDPRVMQFTAENNYTRTYIRRRMLAQATRPENDNLTSPEDAVKFMQNLVAGQIVDAEVSEQIMSILQARTLSGSDPFKPSSALPATAGFIGKSGIFTDGSRNDVGSFFDKDNNRVFFAIFVPKGGAGTDNLISQIEQLAYDPTTTPRSLPGSPVSQTPGTTTGSQVQSTTRFCVKVGTPTEPKPDICNKTSETSATGSTPGSVAAASCPLQGKRVIGCGSFLSDPKYNRGVCAGPDPINRGHCGTRYGCYQGSIAATQGSRRAHSIDVDAPADETVYVPTINGQALEWTYQPGMSYSVAGGDGGGYGHVLTSKVGSDIWVIHLLHTTPATIPSQNPNGTYKSGDPITRIEATGYTHLHINIGLNPTDPNGGSGWLDPESLGMCTD